MLVELSRIYHFAEKWRAGRLRELQRCAEQKAKMMAEGYGTLSTVEEEDLQVFRGLFVNETFKNL